MTAVPGDLLERLRKIEVSTLCDADKTIPIVDPVVRALVPDVRMAGVARTVIAEDDHLSVLTALAAAGPATCSWSSPTAASGRSWESWWRPRRCAAVSRGSSSTATSATSRGSASSACRCSPVAPIPPRGRPSVARPSTGPCRCGGVDVSPGDIVFGDDDGIVIAPAERVAAAVEGAEARTGLELGVLAGIRRGVPLRDLTNYARAHRRARRRAARARWSSSPTGPRAESRSCRSGPSSSTSVRRWSTRRVSGRRGLTLLGVPRLTFLGVLGGIAARGEHHRTVFTRLAPDVDVAAVAARRGPVPARRSLPRRGSVPAGARRRRLPGRHRRQPAGVGRGVPARPGCAARRRGFVGIVGRREAVDRPSSRGSPPRPGSIAGRSRTSATGSTTTSSGRGGGHGRRPPAARPVGSPAGRLAGCRARRDPHREAGRARAGARPARLTGCPA